MSSLTPIAHRTYCPFKGHASYFDLRLADRFVAKAAWSYPTPYDEMRAIEGYLAFPWQVMTAWFRDETPLTSAESLLV